MHIKKYISLFLILFATFFIVSCDEKKKSAKNMEQPARQMKQETTMPPSMGMPTKGSTGSPTLSFANVKVEKAKGENAFTIAEIYEKRDALSQKQVMVKGQVVKVSLDIMGKNWIHIQDGTGNARKMNYDLAVTTKSVPQKGDVVVANGKLSVNRDFGFGYFYEVIIENAELTK
jgi:hypothetical protein